jgi:hypothetical protein
VVRNSRRDGSNPVCEWIAPTVFRFRLGQIGGVTWIQLSLVQFRFLCSLNIKPNKKIDDPGLLFFFTYEICAKKFFDSYLIFSIRFPSTTQCLPRTQYLPTT